MITTRRNYEKTIAKEDSVREITAVRSVQPVRAHTEYRIAEQNESEQIRARRFNDAIAKNFENLLNFKREETAAVTEEKTEDVVAVPVAPVAPVAPAVEEIDLCPSSTTMQFKEEMDEAEVFKDVREQTVTSYKINAKGKLLIAVYALVVVTLFALIVMNTRALKTLDADIANMKESVALLQQEGERVQDDLAYASSEENIINRAENELDMIRPSK